MKIYRHLITALVFLTFIGQSFSQQTVCLGTDVTACIGSSVTIQDCVPGGGSGGAANVITMTSASQSYFLSDDSYTGIINIGFNFEFYGNTYTQCVVGSNGVITFNLSKANQYCPWSLVGVAPLPSAGFNDALNAQMPAYHDMNPAVSGNGEIRTETIGTAPNRQFVVLFKDLIAYGATQGECSYMAVIMNENDNSFEFHLGNKPSLSTWNNGLAIQASQNANGTVAHVTPGRNNQVWTAYQEAKIWTPTVPGVTTDYTITPGNYITVISPTTTLVWANTANSTTQPYNSGNLTVNPVIPGITGYFLAAGSTTCGPAGGTSDTTWITGVASSVTATSSPDICSSGIGSVTANPTSGLAPYSYVWPGLGGATTQTVNNVNAGTYTVQMTDALGCSSSANVTVGDTPATFTGTTTLVSCPGGNDGTATAEMQPVLGNITYQWDDPMAQTTATAVGLSAGTYTCTITSDIGCMGTVVVNVTEIPGMIGNISSQSDATCNSGNDGMITVSVAQGTAPYSYSWDNSTSTTNVANDLYAGTHTCTITDANGCVITVTGTIGEPSPLSITSLTPDTQICPEDEITLNVSGAGGSSPYTFTWFENGTQIGTGTSMTVDPEVTNTQYCVTLSEACGSPTDDECTLIYFPTPIVPSAIPDEPEKCVPGFFEFTNTSSNSSEIASTFWDFGDEDLVALENGVDSTSMLFPQVGTYDLYMTITSIYGCVYTDTISNIMEVLPMPTADFFFSTNPATIFETTVFMQDKSSPDVISWQWISPYSVPSASNSVNPVFSFPDGEVGVYPVTLIVETERGCIDTITYDFNVIEDILFYAPNTFTPDGDEYNQLWKPEIVGIDIYDFDLFIFNRWGELMWESHDPSVGWDGTYKGKVAPAGTYVWRATVKSPINDSRVEFNGFINLIK